MSWLLIVGLKNAVLIAPLALAAFGLSRWSKRPALAHLVWVLVLVKLLTPPLVDVPVGWHLNVEGWLASTAIEAPPVSTSTRSASAGNLTCPLPNSASQIPATATPTASSSAISIESTSAQVAPSHSQHAHERRAGPQAAAVAPALWIPPSPATWLSLASLAWLVGSAAVAAVMVLRAWRFRRFLRLAGRPDARLSRRVRQLARAAGLSAEPTIAVVESAVSPMLWGLGRRATLIFPARLAERLDDDEVDSLLLHELAHFSRGDHWVRLVELAAHVLYWWHPVVWWARREIEAAEEACCDAWVVKHQAGSRRSYAEALLATIEFLSERTPALPPAACGLGDVPLLKVRLTQIVRGETAATMSRVARLAVLCGGVILSPLEPALWATSSSPRRPHQTPRAIPRAAAPAQISGELKLDASAPEPSGSAMSGAEMSAVPPAPTEPPPREDPLIKTPGRLWATAFSPNGRYKLEARTGREIVLSHPRTSWRLDLSSHRIECSSFAPDSESFVTGHADGQLRWWDSETGGLLASYRLGSSKINSVAFAPDGQRIACGLAEGAAIVWDLTSGQETTSLSGLSAVGAVRWSELGDRLAIATGSWSGDPASLLIWNPASNQPQQELALPNSASALQWLTGDTAVLFGDWNGQTSRWNLGDGAVIPGPAVGKDAANAAGWSPDSPLVSQWQVDGLVPGAAP